LWATMTAAYRLNRLSFFYEALKVFSLLDAL
jgi:hypothetical protein